jgi:hypothetical protein
VLSRLTQRRLSFTFVAMKDLKKKHTPEEILDLVNGHIEKGEKSKARYILTLTTRLRIKKKKRLYKVYVN